VIYVADINYPLKTVTDRLGSGRAVIWAIDTQWPLAEAILNERSPETGSSLSGSVTTLRGRLSRTHTKLSDSHHALLFEKAKDSPARDARDDAFRNLFSVVGSARDTFAGALGRSKLEILGFTRRLPNTAEALLLHTRYLIAQVSDPGLDLSGAKPGVVLDVTALVNEGLLPAVDRLEGEVENVGREAKVTQTAVDVKDKALDEYNLEFFEVAHVLESYFRLAGLDKAAARVRPSTRRRGTTEVEPDVPDVLDGLEVPDASDGTDGDTGSGDVNGGIDDDSVADDNIPLCQRSCRPKLKKLRGRERGMNDESERNQTRWTRGATCSLESPRQAARVGR
jgi:hypothetical protein